MKKYQFKKNISNKHTDDRMAGGREALKKQDLIRKG